MAHMYGLLQGLRNFPFAREVGAECCDTQNLNASPIQHKAANRSGWSTTEHM